ncbi:hypothetical protein N7540_004260 [Penicillium herquei]|nr:hypothetical protein N7540_004260 [Penicillium herquei]
MKTFNGNCTLPPDRVNFVSSPNLRGTLDILWSCLSVLLICTWSILHPALPFQTDPLRTIQRLNRAVVRLFWKFSWMFLNLLAPEWSLAKTWADHQSASSLEDGFKKFKEQDGVPWSRAHTHLANMGGFAIQFTSSCEAAPSAAESPNVPVLKPKTDDPSNNGRLMSTWASPVATREESGDAHENPLSRSFSKTKVLNRSNSAPVSSLGQTLPSINDNLAKIQSNPNTDSVLQEKRSVTLGLTQKADRHDKLSQNVKDELRKAGRHFAKYDIEKYFRTLSYRYGQSVWKLDEYNYGATREAIKTVDISHFSTPWEKARFSSTPGTWFKNLFFLQGNLWILDAKQLLLARELGIIKRLPHMSDDELADRNKADQVVKIISVLQIVWFLLQTVTRLVEHLPTSQLEILTLSFAVSTAFTYILLLGKPKDVHTSVILPAARYASVQELSRMAIAAPGCFIVPRFDICIPNNAIHAIGRSSASDNSLLINGMSFSVMIIGLIHCVAWDFVFPTPIERMLWQASSIITATAIPAAPMFSSFPDIIWFLYCRWRFRAFKPRPRWVQRVSYRKWHFQFLLFKARPRWVTRVKDGIGFILFFSFFIARLFAVIEALRSLAFLPPGAFSTTWPNSIPHIG